MMQFWPNIRMKLQGFNGRSKSLKGSALFYALLLSTIIALILVSLISLWAFYRHMHQRNGQLTSLDQLVDSGFHYLLSQPFTDINLVGKDSKVAMLNTVQPSAFTAWTSVDSFQLKSETWGLLQLLHTSGKSTLAGLPKVQKTALIGYGIGQGNSLVIPNNQQPLTLTGNAQIIGDIQVGQVRISTASLNQETYSGGIPHIGGSLPYTPDASTSGSILFPPLPVDRGSYRQIGWQDSLTASFTQTALTFPIPKIRQLTNETFRGKIMIKADSLLIIGKHCILEDVILKAPVIRIEAGFEGSFQAFATQEIHLGNGVELAFPSYLFLAVPRLGRRGQQTGMQLGERVKIAGGVFAHRPDNGRLIPKLTTGKECQIDGLLYWKGPVNMQGQFNGQMAVENFELVGGQQARINYLYNFRINGKGLPDFWTQPSLRKGRKKSIAKWVN